MRKILATSALVLGALASDASAQVAMQPGTIVGTFTAAAYSYTPLLYTAPADRHARVTDIAILNYNVTNDCTASLQTTTQAYFFKIEPGAFLPISLTSGIGLPAGTSLYHYTSGCTNPAFLMQVRGFLFTLP